MSFIVLQVSLQPYIILFTMISVMAIELMTNRVVKNGFTVKA